MAPSRLEAKVYGSYLDAEDQNESYHLALAKPFNLLELVLHKFFRFQHHHNEWIHGAVCLSNPILRFLTGVNNAALAAPARQVANFHQDLELVAGFGPLEGPYKNLNLPQFRWGLGPKSILKLKPAAQGAVRLSFKVQNYFPDQDIDIFFNQKLVKQVRLPENFSNKESSFFTVEVVLNLLGTKNWITLGYTKCENQSAQRPLAVLFYEITLKPTG